MGTNKNVFCHRGTEGTEEKSHAELDFGDRSKGQINDDALGERYLTKATFIDARGGGR